MRWPTARSIAGSAGLAAAFAFGLRAVFPAGPCLGLGRRLLYSPASAHVRPAFFMCMKIACNARGKCDHNFIMVKIGLNGVARNSLV